MSRVIQVRVSGVPPASRGALPGRFAELVAAREWRDGTPWLADRHSRGLLQQLFFDRAELESRDDGGRQDLCAATVVRIAGDEADALALAFILRDISERFSASVELRDPDNSIAKLRRIVLRSGRLPSGDALESILVRRVIYRRMPDGTRMEMIPPRGQGSAFGPTVGDDATRNWSFIVHGIRIVEVSFLGAEAEAMRVFRGLASLPPDRGR